jgi:hypothetical protein
METINSKGPKQLWFGPWFGPPQSILDHAMLLAVGLVSNLWDMHNTFQSRTLPIYTYSSTMPLHLSPHSQQRPQPLPRFSPCPMASQLLPPYLVQWPLPWAQSSCATSNPRAAAGHHHHFLLWQITYWLHYILEIKLHEPIYSHLLLPAWANI